MPPHEHQLFACGTRKVLRTSVLGTTGHGQPCEFSCLSWTAFVLLYLVIDPVTKWAVNAQDSGLPYLKVAAVSLPFSAALGADN